MKMKTRYYDSYSNLVSCVQNRYNDYIKKTDFFAISVVAKYDVMCGFLNSLIKSTDYFLCNVTFEDSDLSGYDDAWICTINEKGEVWVQEALYTNPDRYLFTDSEVLYVHGDVNHKFVQRNSSCDRKIIIFELPEDYFEDEYDENDYCDYLDCEDCSCCKNTSTSKIKTENIKETGKEEKDREKKLKSEESVHLSKDEDGNIHGFFASRSDGNNYFGYSFYMSDEIDEKMINKLLDKFGF